MKQIDANNIINRSVYLNLRNVALNIYQPLPLPISNSACDEDVFSERAQSIFQYKFLHPRFRRSCDTLVAILIIIRGMFDVKHDSHLNYHFCQLTETDKEKI